jgi:hypothetical protein
MRAFIGALTLITPAVSLGSTDTLIQPPATLTHRVVDAAARAQTGITSGLLRLSIGLEDVQDIWNDLDRALAVLDEARSREVEDRSAMIDGGLVNGQRVGGPSGWRAQAGGCSTV